MFEVVFNKIVTRYFYWLFIVYCGLIISCHSDMDPCFPYEETLLPELTPLQDISSSLRIEVKPPFLILQQRLSPSDSIFHTYDSLYVADALHTISGIDPEMADYYADPDMKRVYVNNNRMIFCYGYKKQIDFMDFQSNLISRVKFDFTNRDFINPENEGDTNLSYVCSYLGRYYFYTLFLGKPLGKPSSHPSQSPCLEVYDLNGNPVIRYYLKGKLPVYFAVDEAAYTLYGPAGYEDPEDHLLIYKLKGL